MENVSTSRNVYRLYYTIINVKTSNVNLSKIYPPLLIEQWTQVSQRRMSSNAVVIDFQVGEEGQACRFMRWIDRVAHAFLFQRAKETLHHSIVPTIPLARHAHHHPNFQKVASIDTAGVLAAAITVMQESRLGTAASHSHLEALFLPTPHRSCLTWTSPQRPVNTSPGSRPSRAIPALWEYT
jgi:hypothetical protein